MTSKISFSERLREFRQVYLWSLKKGLPMMALLAVLMFLSFPLILMIALPQWIREMATAVGLTAAERAYYVSSDVSTFFRTMVPISTVSLTLLFAIILCVMFFGYMQKKRSVDLFHALPLGRVPMLLGRWCAGITVLVLPLIVNFLIAGITATAYGVGMTAGSMSLVVMLLLVMLMGTAAFTFSVFMTVCCGTVFDTLISIVCVNVGYPLLLICAYYLADMFLPGLNLNPGSNPGVMVAIAPFAAAYMPFIVKTPSAGFLVWWLCLTPVMLVGSVLLYKRRRSESAENSFVFSLPKIIIRFIVTAVGGVGFGMILSSSARMESGGFFIGLVIGSVLAHVIAEAISSRGFGTLKKSFKWYGAFAAAFLIFYGVLATGFFGYDTRVPEAPDVSSVSVSANASDMTSQSGCNTVYTEERTPIRVTEPVISDPKNIQTVVDAHKRIVALYRSEGFPYRLKGARGESLTLTYHLKNGRTVQRCYAYYDLRGNDFTKPFGQDVSQIVNIPEYIQGLDLIFYLQPDDVKSVDLSLPGTNEKSDKTVVPDAETKRELVSAIEKDFLSAKINFSKNDNAREVLTVNVNFHDDITPKDARLKKMLGGYNGKINIEEGGHYTLYSEDSETYRLVAKMGWIK